MSATAYAGLAEFVSRIPGPVMLLGIQLAVLSPLAALIFAIISYARHREPGRRVPVILYALAIVICGALSGIFGMIFGSEWACSDPKAGNLCGIWGPLVFGPLSCALAIFLVTICLVRIRTPRNSN